MPLRTQRYSSRIIDQHFKNSGGKSVPLVYCMVVYHGEQPYPYFSNIDDIVNAPEEMIGDEYIKQFQVIDVRNIPDEQLKNQAEIGVAEFFMKHINERDLLPFIQEIMDTLKLLEQSGCSNFVNRVLQYALERGEIDDEVSFFKLIETRFITDVGGNVMTLGERLVDRGLQQGLQQGFQKGRFEGKLEVAERLLAEGTDLAFVAKITELSVEEILAREFADSDQ